MLYAIVIAFICAFLVWKYLTWYFDYWKNRGVRGPKPKILHGNFEKSHSGTSNFMEELNGIYLKYKSRERYVGIFTARTPQLFILDPALAVQILTTHFSNFRTNEASMWTTPEMDRLRFTSPMVCTGSSWRETRSDLVPALSEGKMRAFYPVMEKIANKLSDFIQTHIDDVNINRVSRMFTVEVLSDFIWGIAASSFEDVESNSIQNLAKVMVGQAIRCAGFYRKTVAWPLLRKLRPERFFPKSVDKFLTQLTKDVAVLRMENPSSRSDMFTYLLQLQVKKGLPETRMIGYPTTVLLNGSAISGSVIAHCILLLGRNQNAQKKLRNEIMENLDESGALTFDRLNDLPYLDQCVYEALRIFPPVPILSKICTSPIKLENSDGSKVELQPGDKAYISIYSFHRDEDFFENAEDFVPERFDPEAGGTRKYRQMGAFLPFGEGPRICLGMKLGLMEVKTAVVEIVRKFEILVDPSTRVDNRVSPNSFLLALEGGIRLKFSPVI